MIRIGRAIKNVIWFAAVWMLAGCSLGEGGATPTQDDSPRLFFSNIEFGDTVKSPVHLEWASENFTIEPWGDVENGPVVREGAGHAHILIDRPCIKPGEIIPNPSDGSIHHYLFGSTEADLELSPGRHTLCLQAGTGAHTAIAGNGLQVQLSLVVEE